MHITLIAGARPNFMKIAPLIKAIQAANAAGKDIHYRLVHTGQHYDKNMSDTFFEELGIPMPDVNLDASSNNFFSLMKQRILFIDRDGTILREPADEQIDSFEKFSFVPGAISALRIRLVGAYHLPLENRRLSKRRIAHMVSNIGILSPSNENYANKGTTFF